MIDVHCHLIDEKYKDIEVQGLIDKAKSEGVEIIVNGTGMVENRKQIEISEQNENVWVCVGLAYESGITNIDIKKNELREMTKNKKVIGIGEAGLDYFTGMNEELKQYQIMLFEMHLELARELNLPIEVHNRSADADIEKLICGYKAKAVLHCFNGTQEFMKRMAEFGSYFSFGGMITYKKNEKLRDVVRSVPADRLLLETDAPYLPPEPVRGTINMPVNVKLVAERMAVIRGVSTEEIERQTSENARRLFSKMT